MLSVVIHNTHYYSAFAVSTTTETQKMYISRSSRTKKTVSQCFTLTSDRDRTVSRRSEPSSRATFMDEQANP